MKVFIICNSEELPSPELRDFNSIYFVYDTLDVYFGQTQYSGLYCIVEDIPDGSDPAAMPAKNMLYFKMNGDVWVVDNETPKMIAQIDDPSMTEYLEKAGTTFVLRSGYRYIDKQTKAINLPYQNGTNQLSTMVDKPVQITNNTVLIYNEDTNEFEPEGTRYYDEFGRNPEILQYTGDDTDSVSTYIQNDHIHADVKISNKVGNALVIRPDGLYAPAKDFVNVDEFAALVNRINGEITGFRGIMADIQRYLNDELQVDITLSDETLEEKIQAKLEEYTSTIDEAINNYSEVVDDFHSFEDELYEYIRITLDDLRADTINRIEDVHKSWGYFADDFEMEVERVSFKKYKITVPFIVEDNHTLRYKTSDQKIYVSTDENANSYTQFNNGDIITSRPGKMVNVVYCHTDNGNSLIESCSYCKLEEEPPLTLIEVDESRMPVSLADCNNRWTWLDANFLYRDGTFCYLNHTDHRMNFFVPGTASAAVEILETTPSASNFENYDYVNNQIVLRIHRTTNPSSSGYYLAGIQLDPSETRITGVFYGNTSSYVNEYIYGNTNAEMVYVSKDIHVVSGGVEDPDLIIFKKKINS